MSDLELSTVHSVELCLVADGKEFLTRVRDLDFTEVKRLNALDVAFKKGQDIETEDIECFRIFIRGRASMEFNGDDEVFYTKNLYYPPYNLVYFPKARIISFDDYKELDETERARGVFLPRSFGYTERLRLEHVPKIQKSNLVGEDRVIRTRHGNYISWEPGFAVI